MFVFSVRSGFPNCKQVIEEGHFTQVFLQVSMVVQVYQVDFRNGQSQRTKVPAKGNKGLILFPVQVDGTDYGLTLT